MHQLQARLEGLQEACQLREPGPQCRVSREPLHDRRQPAEARQERV